MSRTVFSLASVMLATAALLTSGSGAAAVANVLTNPNFDTNADGWLPSGGGGSMVSRTTENADSAHPAGSALVSNLNGFAGVIAQCVPVTPGFVYAFSGDIFVRPSSLGGVVQVGLKFYPSESCAGVSGAGLVPDSVGAVSSWTHLRGVISAPAGTVSAQFQLIVSSFQDVQSAQFDNLVLRRLVAGDVDGDGDADVADVFFLINYLFAGGPAPTSF